MSMKLFFKCLILILIAGAVGGYIYWNYHKNKIIKDSIENAVNKGTDSLYFIHYDSSMIDELNGNVAFYNVSLQSDSAQKEMLKRTDSLPNVLFNIKVKEISAKGIDVAGLLQSQNVTADKILIYKPIIHIINTGNDKPKIYSSNDTLELYKKMLGNFKNIRADSIQIKEGSVYVTDLAGKAISTLENINVTLNNFIVDSVHDYENIASYFIKDVSLNVENVQVAHKKDSTTTNIEKLYYDAKNRTLKVGAVKHYKVNDFEPLIDLKNISLAGLNTNDFVLYHQFKAENINCDGGLITIFRKENVGANEKKSIKFSSDLIDEIQVGSAKLGTTKLVIKNAADPKAAPFILSDVQFDVLKIVKLNHGNTVSDIVNFAEWKLRSSGFSFFTKDKVYKLTVTDIDIDNKKTIANIKEIRLVPQQSEEAFMRGKVVQTDRYDFAFKNIQLENIDLNQLFNENKVVIQKASLQPDMRIYNDRTLPYDTRSKVGKYPHQFLAKLDVPIYINRLIVRNGYIGYKERGRLSGATGLVFFNNVNATIDNVTNIPEKIKANPNSRLIIEAIFLGKTKINTEWRLPLSRSDSTFGIIGQLQQMDATSLNVISEPLGMTSVKKGKIDNLKFNFTGSDYTAKGEVIFLYKNLGLQVLKKNDDNELVVKDIVSLIANLLVKNNNPRKGVIRPGMIDFNRDITKSFFYHLWKSLFDGISDTIKK